MSVGGWRKSRGSIIIDEMCMQFDSFSMGCATEGVSAFTMSIVLRT